MIDSTDYYLDCFFLAELVFLCFLVLFIITGPPTHSVGGGETSNGHWHLSSVVCNTPWQRNLTHQGAERTAGQ